jgi:hypothetical protein
MLEPLGEVFPFFGSEASTVSDAPLTAKSDAVTFGSAVVTAALLPLENS